MTFVLGISSALASSELCVNSGEAYVDDCFWSNDVSMGISVSPKQLLYLNPFITFPLAPGLIPFSVTNKNNPDNNSGDAVYTLIEIDLLPLLNQQAPSLEVIVDLRVQIVFIIIYSTLVISRNVKKNSFSFPCDLLIYDFNSTGIKLTPRFVTFFLD